MFCLALLYYRLDLFYFRFVLSLVCFALMPRHFVVSQFVRGLNTKLKGAQERMAATSFHIPIDNDIHAGNQLCFLCIYLAAEKDSSLSRFAKFTVKPWTNNCDSDRNTVQLTSHSIITCCATCFAHDTCHMITWNHSTCGIVLDSDAVPCYCKNNCVAYKMLHHFVPKQISFVRAK